MPKTKAIKDPVQAPVTGSGIPTKVVSANPEYFSNFYSIFTSSFK